MGAGSEIADLFDTGLDMTWDPNLVGADPLDFEGYADALEAATSATGLGEATMTGTATLGGFPLAVIWVEFSFLGGSMGVAAGERIARAFDRARVARLPVVTLLASGGARMQEGMVSLVQMPKTVVAAQAHASAGLMQITICRHPTTGGMYASFASRADFLIAEPGATIGFAGPRVAATQLGRPLHPGSHKAEAALEAGQIDRIETLPEAVATVATLLRACTPEPQAVETTPSGSRTSARAWDVVCRARAPDRPSGAALVDAMLTDFVPVHGDRAGADDPSVVAGVGRLLGRPVGVIAKDRHAGRMSATGYRVAARLAGMAGRLGLPLLTLIDTPGADPSEAAERAGIAGAIARTFAALLEVDTPTIAVCVGEGGSGGALALGCADRLYMQETAIFSVIAPEGAAAILHRDSSGAADIASALKITAPDLVDLGIIDGIVPDDLAGLQQVIAADLDLLTAVDRAELRRLRIARWRQAGNAFLAPEQ